MNARQDIQNCGVHKEVPKISVKLQKDKFLYRGDAIMILKSLGLLELHLKELLKSMDRRFAIKELMKPTMTSLRLG